VTDEHSNLNNIHRSASSLEEYHAVVTTLWLVPRRSLTNGQQTAKWRLWCAN